MSDSTRLKSTVYVGGLDQAVTTQTLAEAFVPFGEVVDISLPKPDQPTSTDVHRGFGYVEFDLPQDAKEAMDNMDGSELYGRTIKVAPAKPQRDANEGLGSKTAIWEQVRAASWFSAVASRLIAICRYRRAIWPITQSAKRTDKQQRRLRPEQAVLKTRCRDWNSSTSRDRSPSNVHRNGGHDDNEILRMTVRLPKYTIEFILPGTSRTMYTQPRVRGRLDFNRSAFSVSNLS